MSTWMNEQPHSPRIWVRKIRQIAQCVSDQEVYWQVETPRRGEDNSPGRRGESSLVIQDEHKAIGFIEETDSSTVHSWVWKPLQISYLAILTWYCNMRNTGQRFKCEQSSVNQAQAKPQAEHTSGSTRAWPPNGCLHMGPVRTRVQQCRPHWNRNIAACASTRLGNFLLLPGLWILDWPLNQVRLVGKESRAMGMEGQMITREFPDTWLLQWLLWKTKEIWPIISMKLMKWSILAKVVSI